MRWSASPIGTCPCRSYAGTGRPQLRWNVLKRGSATMSRQWPIARLEQAGLPRRLSARSRDLRRVAGEELRAFHLRLALVSLLLAPLPMYVGGRIRAHGLRLAGFAIGQGTIFWGMPRISGSAGLYRQLRIGQHCWI